MITEINKIEDKTVNLFPVLMIHKDDSERDDPLIVKFFASDFGVTICDNLSAENWRITNWNMQQFEPFHGSITLRNE